MSEGRSCGSLCSHAVHPLCCLINIVFSGRVSMGAAAYCGVRWLQLAMTCSSSCPMFRVQVVTVMVDCNDLVILLCVTSTNSSVYRLWKQLWDEYETPRCLSKGQKRSF